MKLEERNLAKGFTKETLEYLLSPFDTSCVRIKPAKNSRALEYIPHEIIRARLTEICGFGGWDFEILKQEFVDEKSYPDKRNPDITHFLVTYLTTLKLNIKVLDVSFTATGFVTSDSTLRPNAFKTAILGSESKALVRASINLGSQFGLSLYDPDCGEITTNEGKKVRPSIVRKSSLLRKAIEDAPSAKSSKHSATLEEENKEIIAEYIEAAPETNNLIAQLRKARGELATATNDEAKPALEPERQKQPDKAKIVKVSIQDEAKPAKETAKEPVSEPKPKVSVQEKTKTLSFTAPPEVKKQPKQSIKQKAKPNTQDENKIGLIPEISFDDGDDLIEE